MLFQNIWPHSILVSDVKWW